MKQVSVIGGGCSGMMAAISAARYGARVRLLERKDRIGKKLLATGNGRCNLLNRTPSLSRFHGGDRSFIDAVLSAFPVARAIEFFEELGIVCREEGEGRIYPRSGQAAAVLDVLRWELERLKVDVCTGHEVRQIVKQGPDFFLVLAAGGQLEAGSLVLATGGMAGPQFGSDGSGLRLAAALGHRLIDPVAALVPLRLGVDFLRRLKGIRFEGRGQVLSGDEVLRSEQGEFLFTDSGISGPPVLQLSRSAAVALKQKRPARIVLDLFPETDLDELDAALAVRFHRQVHKKLANGLVGLLHKRLIPVLLAEAALGDDSISATMLTAGARRRLAVLFKGWSLPVVGTRPWPEAQVTAGGIAVDEVDPATLESRLLPGLHFCGEVLDVDGDCGGFNLHWAWASGWSAGFHAAGS